MKSVRHHKRKLAPISTLKELQNEKFRLQREIANTEEGIKENYSSLIEALTFRNLVNTIAEEIIATNMIVSQAYSIIRPLFTRKKKKKRTEKPLEEIEPEVDRRRTIKNKRETDDISIIKGNNIRNEG